MTYFEHVVQKNKGLSVYSRILRIVWNQTVNQLQVQGRECIQNPVDARVEQQVERAVREQLNDPL